METTSLTLLEAAREGIPDGWQRLDRLYRPFVYSWLRGHDVSHHDANDLAQATLTVVSRKLISFEHSGQPGAFRTWVRRIMAFEIKRHWRDESVRNRHLGTSEDTIHRIEGVADETSPLIAEWDRQHDEFILKQLLQQVVSEFQPATIVAFRESTLGDIPVADVARKLGITEGAVYIARSRVLKRLREVAVELL